MTTNRIKFIDQNESAFLPGAQSTIVGYTVVKAPRGNSFPIKFPRGSEQAIKALIGTPSQKYPDIQEAIEFNKEYSLYVSAPAGTIAGENNFFGGIYLTTYGSIEKFYEVTDPEFPNFIAKVIGGNTNSKLSQGSIKQAYAAQTITIDTINNVYFELNKITKFEVSYTSITNPSVKEVVKLKLGTGNNIVTDDINEYDVGDIIDNGNGTSKIVLVGNDLVTNFDLTAAGDLDTYLSTPANYATLEVSWFYNIEDTVVQTFYQNSPRNTETTFILKKVDLDETVGSPAIPNPYYNTITMSFSEGTEFNSVNYIMSTDINKVDGFNQSLFYENILDTKAKWYIGTKAYKHYTDITAIYSVPYSNTVSGYRLIDKNNLSAGDLLASLQAGWNELNDPAFDDTFIAFDNTGIPEIKTTHASLRNSTLKLTTFLSPIKAASNDTATAVGQIQTARSSAPNTLGGLGYSCNEFLVRDSSGSEYWSSIIGSVSLMYARIMDVKLGGAAPMWTNDGQGLGGQINRSVRKQKYKFLPDHLDTLNDIGVNPIVIDNFYGLMLTSQKTASSAAFLTDWSFFGHSMAFDMLKREIYKGVLVPQLGKAISPFYLELRQSQTQAIVNKRLFGATAIWNDAIVLVNNPEVNNNETKMQNKFVVKVRVKVNPFTEYVDFILNNVGQTTEL